MGKFIVIIIILIILLGLALYFEPDKTKDITSGSIDKIGSAIKNYMDSKEKNLGYPKMPCSKNEDCNNFIEECSSNCTCEEGSCYRNVPINTT